MTLVDTNILLDAIDSQSDWSEWSRAHLLAASMRGVLFINEIVYAELAVRFDKRRDVDDFLSAASLTFLPISRDALFLASRVFRVYRRQGGPRSSILPDFFIGAQAAVHEFAIITRDTRRYKSYFPDLELIAPGAH